MENSDVVERAFSVVSNLAKLKDVQLHNVRKDLCEFDVIGIHADKFIELIESLGFSDITQNQEPVQYFRKGKVVITLEVYRSKGVLRVQFEDYWGV
jgi:hypothetical protein